MRPTTLATQTTMARITDETPSFSSVRIGHTFERQEAQTRARVVRNYRWIMLELEMCQKTGRSNGLVGISSMGVWRAA